MYGEITPVMVILETIGLAAIFYWIWIGLNCLNQYIKLDPTERKDLIKFIKEVK